MSLLGNKWKVLHQDKDNLLEQLKQDRNLQNPLQTFHDPQSFADMTKALTRIQQAIDNQERIIIFGDYDVDGMTSCAIVFKALKTLNAQVSYRLPHRVNDGYGLSEKFIDEFHEKDIKLIITVDCGIACTKEVAKANQYGIDTIITDHHRIPEVTPDALAILHPKHCTNYPYKELTGAGVAYKLAEALLPENHPLLEDLLALACMGTVADLGPLNGENRLIVQQGLTALAHTRSAGLNRLKQLSNIKPHQSLETFNIGFQMAPRLNAAGRIGNPYDALAILLSEDPSNINLKANQLEALNNERRTLTNQAHFEITKRLNAQNLPSIIIEHSPDWHVGILGLIASKIVQAHNKPAIILQDRGDYLTASARSPEYFNVIDALSHHAEHLITFGGHAQAAGFSIQKNKLKKFTELLNKYTANKIRTLDTRPTIEIDCALHPDDINANFFQKIQELAPFGVANPEPIFMLRQVTPSQISQIGREKTHLSLRLDNHKVVAFNLGDLAQKLRHFSKIDLVFKLNKNTFNGRTTIDLHALDFRASQV